MPINSHEFKVASNKYYSNMLKIEESWKTLQKDDFSSASDISCFISECTQNINDYKQMVAVGGDAARIFSVPAYKRLASLYEKKHDYYNAVAICSDAVQNEIDLTKKLSRNIARSGRIPTSSESSLIAKTFWFN